MNRNTNPITILVVFALATVFMAACGGGGGDSIEGLLEQKKELEKQMKDIEAQIAEIDKQLAATDTTPKADDLDHVEAEKVAKRTLRHFINVQGQIESDNNVMVYPKSQGGVITAVYVDEGQFVNKGDTMAKIEDKALRKNLAAVRKSLELANTAFERQQRLWNDSIGSEMQYLQAKNQKETLEKQIEAMEEQIAMNRITAPISGVVDKVFAKVGQVVSSMSPVGAFQMVNMNDISFKANISESYISKVHVGDSVTIYFDAIDDSVRSRIKTIGQTIDPTSRTIAVEVSLNGADKPLKANMIGEMKLNDATREAAVVVHQDFLSKTADGYALFVAQQEGGGWKASKRDVTIGLRSGNFVEIKSGLKAGDMLVTRGFRELNDGQKISVN